MFENVFRGICYLKSKVNIRCITKQSKKNRAKERNTNKTNKNKSKHKEAENKTNAQNDKQVNKKCITILFTIYTWHIVQFLLSD